MKMNYLLRNNIFNERKRKPGGFVISIIIVILLIFLFGFSVTRGVLFKMATPFWWLSNSVHSFFSYSIETLQSKTSLILKNNLLKEENNKIKQQIALFEIVKKENEDLKSLLGRKTYNKKYVLAAVLVKPFLSPYDSLIIDIGESDGVSVGDKVIADGNVYIGYVFEVYSDTSKVILYSSPGQKVNVLVGENNIEKGAVGIGGGNFRIEIPREIGVVEGDTIIIPSISPNVFGLVEKVIYKESDSFQTVLFKNLINIGELKWVEVVTLKK